MKKTPKNDPVEMKLMCQQCGVALCQDHCFRDYHAETLKFSKELRYALYIINLFFLFKGHVWF